MSKVLYSGDEDAAVRALPARPAQQPVAVAQQAQTGTQQRVPERRVEEMLEQNRQRVLSPQTAATTAQTTVAQPVQRPVTSAAITFPVPCPSTAMRMSAIRIAGKESWMSTTRMTSVSTRPPA